MNNILKGAVVLLIAILMVFSTVAIADTTKLTNKQIQSKLEVTGLAPNTMRNAGKHPLAQFGERGQFYGQEVLTLDTCTFDLNAVINNLYSTGINWLSGADFGPDGKWYAVSYTGGLYTIDTTTGIPTFIANTISLNSLVYDTTTDTWYCCGLGSSYIDSLYTIDISTGATTFIGYFDAPEVMISLMCDSAGNMYAYDVTFYSNSHLYDINKFTGEATNPKDMGHVFCYAQEGKFDRNTDTLYLAAYDIGLYQSYLATCDPATGAVTIINQFSPALSEIDALAIPYNAPPSPPTITGPTSVKPGTSNSWTFHSNDPDTAEIKYVVDWGDGIIEETECVPPCTPQILSHTYTAKGTYVIKAKAVECPPGTLESAWSEFEVIVPRDKAVNKPLSQFLLSQPNLFPILQKILQNLGL
jgi:hypothetical protein